MIVRVRRHWNDHNEDEVAIEKLEGFHWSSTSGGASVRSPRQMIHAYVWCDEVPNVSHSGIHGKCPHRIKVCIVKKIQEPGVFEVVKAHADKRTK